MPSPLHVAVYVESIPEAVEQYRKLLGIEPAKVRHDYAKFELADPPVIFSLNVRGEAGTLSHLGIRYAETAEVATELVRVKQTDIPLLQQRETTSCCFSIRTSARCATRRSCSAGCRSRCRAAS